MTIDGQRAPTPISRMKCWDQVPVGRTSCECAGVWLADGSAAALGPRRLGGHFQSRLDTRIHFSWPLAVESPWTPVINMKMSACATAGSAHSARR